MSRMRPPAVIIVNHNTRAALRESIAAATSEHAREVVVVDNASSDGSVAMVRGAFPGVVVVANASNRGYGPAANQGMALIAGPFAVLLNGDACLEAGALAALGRLLDEQLDVAVVGPRLLNEDGSLQSSCYAFPGSLRWILDNDVLAPLNRLVPFVRGRFLRTWRHDRERRVPWIKGAAMAIRRSAFDAVGGFDESFPLFYEETDLCHRLGGAGWRVLFSPAATVHHSGGASTGDREADVSLQLFAGQVQFFQRYSPRLQMLWTLMLKALEIPSLFCDSVRLLLTRRADRRAVLARRIAERWRKLRLDRHRPDAAWRAAVDGRMAPRPVSSA